MKPVMLIGIVLIVAGAVALGMGFYRYTEKETVFQIGDLRATTEEKHAVPLKPVGIALLGVGLVLVIVGVARKS